MSHPLSSDQPAKRRSLRWQLILPLNVAVAVIVVSFLAWDTWSEWGTHLEEKRITLGDEAETVLSAVLLHEADPEETLQGFVDEACGYAQRTSPGHHIVVQNGDEVLQAASDHRDPAGMLESMREGAASASGLAWAEDGQIIVGSAGRDDASVWVSEHLDDVRGVLRRQVLRRVVSILVLGGVIGVVINLLVSRLVTRPLRGIVDSVRRMKAGELGVQAPPSKTEELEFLTDEFNAASAALAAADQERRFQMEKARQIQDRLLPSPKTAAGLGAAFIYEPASEVGGDYLDIRPTEGGKVVLSMADVIGHGVPAAMGAAVLKTLLGCACAQATWPDLVLSTIRQSADDILMDSDFASMIVVALDRSAGRLWYASAGHPPGYLIQPGRPIRGLPATGPLLGVPGTQAWETVSMDVRPGDRLVLVTDGLMEAANEAGEPYGLQRLEAAVEEFRAEPPDRLCHRIMERVRAFRGAAAQNDDMTILAIEV